jgi:hypothetical protein
VKTRLISGKIKDTRAHCHSMQGSSESERHYGSLRARALWLYGIRFY